MSRERAPESRPRRERLAARLRSWRGGTLLSLGVAATQVLYRVWRSPVLVPAVTSALLVIGALTMFTTIESGPGGRTPLVTGGLALIPWYGLSSLGTFAAVTAAVLMVRGHEARPALILSFAGLTGWIAFSLLGTNNGMIPA